MPAIYERRMKGVDGIYHAYERKATPSSDWKVFIGERVPLVRMMLRAVSPISLNACDISKEDGGSDLGEMNVHKATIVQGNFQLDCYYNNTIVITFLCSSR